MILDQVLALFLFKLWTIAITRLLLVEGSDDCGKLRPISLNNLIALIHLVILLIVVKLEIVGSSGNSIILNLIDKSGLLRSQISVHTLAKSSLTLEEILPAELEHSQLLRRLKWLRPALLERRILL